MTDEESVYLEKSIAFIRSVGIEVRISATDEEGFLPGITIDSGVLYINRSKLLYPGDVLHEAGHIAVVPSAERHLLNAETISLREAKEAEEMSAISWSYAAALHLNINPTFVFHDSGYKGGAQNLLENFAQKRYLAVPMLQWIGLTLDEKNAAAADKKPFPHMVKWLRD